MWRSSWHGAFRTENEERQDPDIRFRVAEVFCARVDLIECGNGCPFSEIPTAWGRRGLAQFALHGEKRKAVPKDNEVHFSFVGIANVSKVHVVPFGVLLKMAVLEKLTSHHVLEPCAWILNARAVPEV